MNPPNWADLLLSRWRRLFCRHQGGIHLCQPPSGVPSLVICQKCDVVMRRYPE